MCALGIFRASFSAEELAEKPQRWGNWVLEGDAEKALDEAADQWSASYTTSMNLHAPLEPGNAVVELIDDIWHAWTGNQNQISAVFTDQLP